MKNIKARYPNKLSRDKYITVLSNEYLAKNGFPFLLGLSSQQVVLPIKVISGLIDYMISEHQDYSMQLLRMNTLKQIKNNVCDEQRLSNSMHEISSFLKGRQRVTEIHAKRHKVPLPSQEYMPQYLEFVKSTASRIIDDICRATEAKIPYAAKLEYERWMNSDKENIGETDTEQLTFAQRIEQERKPLADAADRDTEESMPNAKKPRVSFADEVIKKKTADSSGEVEEKINDSNSSASEDNSSMVTGGTDDKKVEAISRSIGIEDDKKEDDDGTAEKCSTQYSEPTDEQKDALLNPQLNQLYSWLSKLPECLREQMLDSAPVQALIETVKQDAAIYDSQYIYNQLSSLFTIPKAHNLSNEIADHPDEKVIIANYTSEELVDTSMIFSGLQTAGLILPVESVGSAEILPDPMFHGLEVL